jgi:hypothetical protein
VLWITCDCDLHHNFRVNKNYKGTTPRSASRAPDLAKKNSLCRIHLRATRKRQTLPLFGGNYAGPENPAADNFSAPDADL